MGVGDFGEANFDVSPVDGQFLEHPRRAKGQEFGAGGLCAHRATNSRERRDGGGRRRETPLLLAGLLGLASQNVRLGRHPNSSDAERARRRNAGAAAAWAEWD